MLAEAQLFDQFAARVRLAPLSAAGRERLLAASQCLSLTAGEAAKFDRAADRLVFLASGATKLVAHASKDRQQIVAFHFANDLFGVPAAASHVYSLVALADVRLLTFGHAELVELLAHHGEALGELLAANRTSLARCREKTVLLGCMSAPERVAGFLFAMARRIGMREAGQIRLELPMTRRDIADSLGITVETVSRQLTALRTSGIVETSGRSTVRIVSLQRLYDSAGFVGAEAEGVSEN